MEPAFRLRTKIGDFEFDAEGPPAQVQEQFAAWRQLVEATLAAKREPSANPESTANQKPDGGTWNGAPSDALTQEQLRHVFMVDDKRELVTLRALPRGDDRHSQGIALVLYGYRSLRQEDEVLVTRLKASLEASGSVPDRIDRAAAPLLTRQSVVKSGAGKGGRYRLTNSGVKEAEASVRALVEQLS